MPESSLPAVASLTPHPTAGAGPVRTIEVACDWREAHRVLSLTYRIEAVPGALRLPATARPPRRTDGLWRHTCLEAFIRPAGGSGYVEFNFSPSGDWAAYRFDARRRGMQLLVLARDPVVAVSCDAQGLRVSVELDLRGLPQVALEAGLTAVIEAADGHFGYWALRHGDSAPDFHDPGSFTLRLGAPATEPPA